MGFNLGPYENPCRAHWATPDDPMPEDFSFQLFPDVLERLEWHINDAMARVPLLQKAFQQKSNGTDLISQPADSEVRTELSALIDRLVTNGASSANVAKGACAAALGSGALSIL